MCNKWTLMKAFQRLKGFPIINPTTHNGLHTLSTSVNTERRVRGNNAMFYKKCLQLLILFNMYPLIM